MSILEEIANPKGINVGESLKLMDMLETNKINRKLADIQAGSYLQKMRADAARTEAMNKGYKYIQDKLGGKKEPAQAPLLQDNLNAGSADIAQSAAKGEFKSPEPIMLNKEMVPAIVDFSQKNLSKVDPGEIDKAKTAEDIAATIGAVPGMENVGKFYLDVSKQIHDRISKETKEQRDQMEQAMEVFGNPMKEVATAEQSGDTETAKRIYEQTIANIAKDPRFKDIPEVQNLIDTFDQYQPGLGKYMYITTMMGSKARDQFQKEAGQEMDKKQLAETVRHNKAMEKISDQKAMIADLKANKPAGFKSADANTIYRMAVGYHGGMFDENGNLKMLDPKKAQDVQDLSSLAAIIYSRGKVSTHNEAITEAAKQLNMEPEKAAKTESPMAYKSKEDVRSDVLNGKISKEEGIKILNEQFDMK